MANALVTILGREVEVGCAEADIARIEDLAKSLESRLEALPPVGDADALRRLSLVALALVAENQAARAALARAHIEVDRLHEIMIKAPPARPNLRVVR